MRLKFVAFFLIASICAAQTPASLQQISPASPATDAITVPMETLVALNLITTIKSKSTKPGDPVRAVVAFPLAIGSRVAIPAGTFVEGVVDKVNAHPKRGGTASAQIRFTRLLFANGYAVPLVATNVQAKLVPSDPRRIVSDQLADARDGAPYLGEGFAGQNPPTLPPLPSNGPSPAALAGIGIGASVGLVVLALVVGHHRAGSSDFILFDAGWQFQMSLQEPLTLDAAQISAAAKTAQ